MPYAQHFAEFTDQATGGPASMAITSTTPTNLIANQTGSTVVIQGTNTSWVNGVTTFGVSGLTGAAVTGTSIVNGTQVATLTVTTSTTNTGGTLTFSDSLDAATAPATVLANATTYTFTGPSGGGVGAPSTNFTVAFAASTAFATNVIVTPSDGGGGGAFTPTTVTLTADTAAASATFTYTPATSGVKTLSVTNNGGLSNPSNLSYTSTLNPGQASDPNITISPYNIRTSGTAYWETIMQRAYWKFQVDGTTDPTLAVQVDLSPGLLHTPPIQAGDRAQLAWSIDWGVLQTHSFQSDSVDGNNKTTLVLARSLAAGKRDVQVWCNLVQFTNGNTDDCWLGDSGNGNRPAVGLSIAQFTKADAATAVGSTFTAAPSTLTATYAWPYLRAKNVLLFADSRGMLDTSWDSWPTALADALKAELGNIAIPQQGWNVQPVAGATNIPKFHDGAGTQTWDKYSGSFSRLVGGKFTPTPDLVMILEYLNDSTVSQAQIADFITQCRAACSSTTPIVFLIFGRPYADSINYRQRLTAAITAAGDANVHYWDLSAFGALDTVGTAEATTGWFELSRGISKEAAAMGNVSLRSAETVHSNANYNMTISALLTVGLRPLLYPAAGGSGGGRRRYQ